MTILADDVHLEPPRPEPGHAPPGGDRPANLVALIAAASAAAGAIHFAFSPDHFTQAWTHGLFFALVAALQIAWAAVLIARPSRRMLLAGTLQLVVVGVWIVSRTVGIPLGSTPEPVGLPDTLASVLEVFCAVGGVLAVRLVDGRPAHARSLRRPSALALALITLMGALTIVSLTPRYAGAHSHGHDAAAGAAGTSAGAGHVHGAAAGVLDGSTPCEKSGPAASVAQTTDAEGHDHRGPAVQQILDEPTREALAAQQVLARAVAAKYPTVADAEAAGYRMSTPYVPCIGAHYTNPGLVLGFDPSAPSELLYDGTTPSARIVGLSYLVYHPSGPPEGFAGPNDQWHQHNFNGGLCFGAGGVVIGGEALTRAQCAAIGGRKRELVDVWMVHDWVVPGWECSWGVFAAECPELGGRAGGSAWDPTGR